MRNTAIQIINLETSYKMLFVIVQPVKRGYLKSTVWWIFAGG